MGGVMDQGLLEKGLVMGGRNVFQAEPSPRVDGKGWGSKGRGHCRSGRTSLQWHPGWQICIRKLICVPFRQTCVLSPAGPA